ncbi:ABC transporter ATP-binding protein [Paenibacillus sp. IB182496]|uniref:ABC transporter ATP-binding protein n=1 Tax=Paenibacillus sabuli TaxID=2772509 RepID=A0A927BVM5_9BACL|nr:ABC transporter ATP-binding protein [Paenibacillus sabuli]MBD2847676.1 ABC transporter ATP-binding protein [Paenibacillus sabuli]
MTQGAGSEAMMLQVGGLRVSYGGRRAGRDPQGPILSGVSFALGRGEVTALLGESGSGKSTIARALTGLLPPSARIEGGLLRLGEEEAVDLAGDAPPWDRLRGRRIGMLFQDAQLALNPLMTIRAQFEESLRAHRLAGRKEAAAEASRLLRMLGFSEPGQVLHSYPFELSGGMCQRVCLALALCLRPDVLIADEPTSALDADSQRHVLELLRRLQGELGLTVLFITHDLAAAQAISDRVIVLREGRIVEDGAVRTVMARPSHAYTRALLAARASLEAPAPRQGAAPDPAAPLLEVRQLRKSYARGGEVLRGIDLTVHRGEIVGILGRSGCGKSTLARCIVALEAPDGGQALLEGRALASLPRRELSRRVQLIFQNARASLNPGRTALQLVTGPLRDHRMGGRRERAAVARALLDDVGLTGELQVRRPPQLSTGQCQRIAIARALALQPELLICDEAVSALDMRVQAQIVELLLRLQAERGFAMLMISHDERIARRLCDTVAVMERGRFVERASGGPSPERHAAGAAAGSSAAHL